MIKKSAVVPYNAEQMYDLVNDIDSYPEFLPWCSEARVFERSETRLKASISMASGSIKQSFSTVNTMQPGRRIDVHLLRGPFKYLDGHWLFEPLEDGGCRISLEMHFEFRNKLLKLTLNKLFNRIVDSLVGSFSERARRVYGRA